MIRDIDLNLHRRESLKSRIN